MKTIKQSWVFILLVLLFHNVSAQEWGMGGPLRQRIFEAKLREIRKSLNLDQPTMDRFRPVYADYEKELNRIDLREQNGIMTANPDSISAEEAERIILKQISTARKLIELREKYYTRFKTVLTPQQIIRLYRTETMIRRKVMNEMRRRFGNRYYP